MNDPLKNHKMFGRYKLIQMLGRGGMGVVYLAMDTELSRQVAIKCVEKKATETKLAKRLRTEARLQAQLNHPNIVQLHDVIENDEVLGLVIEYVEGANLMQKCTELLADQNQRLNWLIQIAEGLEKAHQAGITHCDLKPENVLVTHQGDVKIADFGIAKARLGTVLNDDRLTEFGNVTGSYFSLSPEQATGADVDFRTDLFSFGILAHLLLTGRHPFGETKNHLVMVQRIINDEFLPDTENQSDLTPELIRLISSLLEKNPNNRPANATAVASYLRNEVKRGAGEEPESDDLTVEFAATQPRKAMLYSYRSKIVVLALMVVIAISLIFWPRPPAKIVYVAVAKPSVTATDNMDADQLKRIATTIEQSIQEMLLLMDNISLIADTGQQQLDGDPAQLALVNAADAVLLASVSCTVVQCDIRLQKLEGDASNSWTVSDQRNWPVLTDSLADIRTTTLAELPGLFPEFVNKHNDGKTVIISEQDYRTYLQIYQSSAAGTGAKDKDLVSLAGLQSRAPDFISIYSLYSKAAWHLHEITGEESYLQRLHELLTAAPAGIGKTPAIKTLQFELLLQRGDTQQAALLLTEIEKLSSDRVQINDLKASLAYAKNDYQVAMQLEQENSLLIPSASRYYKLAVSQYMLGDLASANQSIENALALSPGDLYALDLSGAIAFTQGDALKAVDIYTALVKVDANSGSLSNFGLALTLNGDLQAAIKNHTLATALNPQNPGLWLNLADSYDLSRDTAEAAFNYQRVLDLTTHPSSVQDYSIRAQAQSHLGKHNEAIKTLRLAQGQFPSMNELNYAAAIVHAFAGNYQAAVVEVEAAIGTGTAAIWFRFHWFKELCNYPRFRQLTESDQSSVCSSELHVNPTF